MKGVSTIAAWLSCAILLLLPAGAHAEIAIAESTEWALASSDRVIVGKVVKFDAVLDRDGKKCQAISVTVSKTFKGAHADQVTFLLPNFIGDQYGKQWSDEGLPIVFCLVKNDEKRVPVAADKYPWVVRDDGNGACAILLGKSQHHWTGCRLVLTREFEVLTNPEAIVKFVEQTISAQAAKVPTESMIVDVPWDTPVCKLLYSRSAVWLTVPVDERLEAQGVKWCQSTTPRERREGARILSHFKSEQNIALLKSLLNDPSTRTDEQSQSVAGKSELVYRKKVFFVRQVAFDALTGMGVFIQPPVLEVLLEGRNEPDLDSNADRLKLPF